MKEIDKEWYKSVAVGIGYFFLAAALITSGIVTLLQPSWILKVAGSATICVGVINLIEIVRQDIRK